MAVLCAGAMLLQVPESALMTTVSAAKDPEIAAAVQKQLQTFTAEQESL